MTAACYGTSDRIARVGARLTLTLFGAAGLIIGAFLRWIGGIDGTKLDIRALWTTGSRSTDAFVRTAGFGMIVLGLVAVIGLAFESGWLTRAAGAVAIVGVILLGIHVYRSDANESLQTGAWIVLVGGVVTLVGGLVGSRPLPTPTRVLDG